MQDKENNTGVMEWWRVDRMDTIWWGLSFIWGALVLLAGIIDFGSGYTWWNGWAVFFAGLGTITLIGIIIRLMLSTYRRKLISGFIWGILFLAIGLGIWGNAEWFWVAVIFVAGLAILGVAFVRNGNERKAYLSFSGSATDEETDATTRKCKMAFCPMSKNCPMTFCPMNEEVG